MRRKRRGQRVMVQFAFRARADGSAKRIIFDSSRGGNSDIWMVNPEQLSDDAEGQRPHEPQRSARTVSSSRIRDATANRLVVRDLATARRALYTNLLGRGLDAGRPRLRHHRWAGELLVAGPLLASERQPWGVDWVSGRLYYTTDSGTGSGPRRWRSSTRQRRTASSSCRRRRSASAGQRQPRRAGALLSEVGDGLLRNAIFLHGVERQAPPQWPRLPASKACSRLSRLTDAASRLSAMADAAGVPARRRRWWRVACGARLPREGAGLPA